MCTSIDTYCLHLTNIFVNTCFFIRQPRLNMYNCKKTGTIYEYNSRVMHMDIQYLIRILVNTAATFIVNNKDIRSES